MKKLYKYLSSLFIILFVVNPLCAEITTTVTGGTNSKTSSLPKTTVTIQKDMQLVPNQNITKMKSYDTSLPPRDFAIAALIASGVKGSDIAGYLQKLETIYKGYETYRVTKNTQLNDAEAGILYLYDKKILTEYIAGQTYLDVLLDTGTYNCVSSAVIYMYMMKRKGFKVIANETHDHVFCTVLANGKEIDVETTNAFGYAPGVVKNVNSSSTPNYSTTVIKTDYEDRKRISGRRLISTIFHNRIVFESSKPEIDNEVILQLSIDSCELQKESKESLQDMYNQVGNILYRLSNEGNYMESLYVAKAVTEKYGHHGKSKLVTNNAAYAFNKLYNQYSGDLEKQNQLFETYSNCLAKETYDAFYEAYIYNNATFYYNSGNLEKAKELILKGLSVLEENKNLKNFLETYLK